MVDYLFICKDESDKLIISSKKETEETITAYEELDADLPFTVIGRIAKPVTLDFNPQLIEWYDKEEKQPGFIHNVELAIIAYLL